MNSAPTDNAIKWLTQIIVERFDIKINLIKNATDKLSLKLASEEKYIDVIINPDFYKLGNNDLPCAHWDASLEGWQATLTSLLPTPGLSRVDYPLIQSSTYGYIVNYDILGLTYWMLTRSEEVERIDLDSHSRFPAKSSHAFKYEYLERPIVDEWLCLLGQIFTRTWLSVKLKQNDYSLNVTHDVDWPSSYMFTSLPSFFKNVAKDFIKNRNVECALLRSKVKLVSRNKLDRKDPYNTFDWIMDVSERNNIENSFYFMTGKTSKQFDGDYSIDHPAMRYLLRNINQRGHAIGLHPSYNTYRNKQKFLSEANKLHKVAESELIHQEKWGGRMHYLRWEHPTTMYFWEEAGLDYDSTLGYADRVGFRCGTCFEYSAFDPVDQKILKLRIRPLIAMEVTVLESRYMSLQNYEDAFSKFVQMKRACIAVGGCFTLLWHNSVLISEVEKELFKNVIAG